LNYYPGSYRSPVPPRCPHCKAGKVLIQREDGDELVTCDQCNGTGLLNSMGATFAILCAFLTVFIAVMLYFNYR
jgi:hypothetical protein